MDRVRKESFEKQNQESPSISREEPTQAYNFKNLINNIISPPSLVWVEKLKNNCHGKYLQLYSNENMSVE